MSMKFGGFVLSFQNSIHTFWEKQYASQRNKLAREEWLFFGTKSVEERLLDSRKYFIKASKIILAFAFLFLVLCSLRSAFEWPITDKLGREEYGGKAKRVDVKLEATYLHSTISQREELLVLPKVLSSDEEEARINQCIALLTKDILGNNAGFMRITEDLNLPLCDSKTGVSIEWESDNPLYVNAKGEVDFLTLTQREKIVLTAHLTIGKSEKYHSFVLFLKPFPEVNYTKNLERSIKAMISALNKNVEGTQLDLPEKGVAGEILQWSTPKKEIPLFFIPFCLFLLMLVYFLSPCLLVGVTENPPFHILCFNYEYAIP